MSNDRSSDQNPESAEPEFEAADEIATEDALGAGAEPRIETQAAAEQASEIGGPTEKASENDPSQSDSEETDSDFDAGEQPAPKLERLQKILAQAGVASRRHAEELISGGHVEVNGQVVTTLGSKADAARDHIRVDGKLLRGAERLRYFVLNKPKGFVTTAKDPEGRPTVMHFFEKMHERLYPVGRLDYQSEGLLLVTNDGELANKLTRAASGVEKTYLVKVSGQPTEAELDILRGGIAIDRSQPGAGKVNTAPARIRQVRQGDNPWYEVVLIEGRNRELRKMFQEIGHFVEKIRRVGYGPLVLDIEPGKLRELDPGELATLRKAAEGKGRVPKSKEMRQRHAVDAAQLPTVAPRPSPRPARSFPAAKPFAGTLPKPFPGAVPKPVPKPIQDRATPGQPTEFRPNKPFGPKKSFGEGRTSRPSQPRQAGERFNRNAGASPAGLGSARNSPSRFGPARPAFQRDDRSSPRQGRPPARFAAGARDAAGPGTGRVPPGRPFPAKSPAKPAWKSSGSPGRPFRGGEGGLSRPFSTSSGKPRAGGARPSSKPGKPYKAAGRVFGTGPKPRSASEARPAATGTGARPSRPYSPRPENAFGSRPRNPKSFAAPPEGSSSKWAGAKSGSGWKPKPNFSGKPRAESGGRSKSGSGLDSGSSSGSRFRPPSDSGPRGSRGKGFSPHASGNRPRPKGGKRT